MYQHTHKHAHTHTHTHTPHTYTYTHIAEEDTFGLYSRVLLKYFLAEGVVCGHELLVASVAEKPEHIIKVGHDELMLSNEYT